MKDEIETLKKIIENSEKNRIHTLKKKKMIIRMDIKTNNLNEEINNLRNEILLIQKNNLLKPTHVRHESPKLTNEPSKTLKAGHSCIYFRTYKLKNKYLNN